MIFQCVAVILVCYFTAELESKFIAPIIFQRNDAVINTGENLTLSCEGMEPLTWTIVNYKQINYDKASVIKSVKNAEDSKFPYGSILRIENASYINTGFFYCHGIKASKDDTDRSSNIYVYVKDENRLSIVPPVELAIFTTKPGNELTIPCLPTSPDIQVILRRTYDEEEVPQENNFDPRTGFKIRMFSEEQEVFCIFTRNNQNQTITIFLDDYGLPKIGSSLVYDPSGRNIAHVGNKLVLLCSIIIPYNSFYTFQWVFNETEIKKNNRISIINNPVISIANGRLLSSTLKIDNVTMEDEGEYYCYVTVNAEDALYPSSYITVLENPAATIEAPKINYPSSEIFLQVQDNLTIVCEASESVSWYFDDLIKYDENINITIYQKSKFIHKAILIITNASVYNVGSFVCRPEHVKNDHPLRSNKIFIYVQDKNYLSKYVGNYGKVKLIVQNTISNIPCIPSSPDITVNLIDADGHKVSSEIASFSPKLGFTFIGKDRGLRNYTCLYQKGNISEELFIRILVLHNIEYDKTSFIEGPDKATIYTGQDLQLNCSMMIYDALAYNKDDLYLNWTFPELLANDDKLLIEEEELYALSSGKILVRRLTVKNVDLKAEGDYECILYDRLLNRVNYISKYITVLGPIDADLEIQIPKKKYVVTGENLILNCSVKVNHNVKFSLYWGFNNEPVKITTRISTTDLNINQDTSGVTGSILLIIKNITLAETGTYNCIIRNDLNSSKYIERNITVHEPKSPTISQTNLNNTEWKLQEGKSMELHCLSTGIPVPTTIWLKNDRPWIIDRNQTRISIQDNNATIKFLYTRREDEGKYTCHVSNIAGKIERRILLSVFTDPSKWTTTQIIFIVILIILLVALVTVLVSKIIKEKKRKSEFEVAGLNHFEEGAVENISPNLGLDSQAELLPYDKTFEIPRDKLKLGKQLGSGFFGVVIEAEAAGIFPNELKKTVAVKMVKGGADYMHIKALLSELKIMIHLGKHLNVVNLLGACTRNISKRELLVVVEYCRYGNIQDFLLKQRNRFINQIDPKTDLVNITIGEKVLKHFAKHNNVDRQPQVCYYNVIKEDSIYENIALQADTQQSHSSTIKGNEIKPTCTHDLLCWSYQIAQGMEYLASRKVLHGDLAARNILLAEDNIVKICDFGLAKNMYKNNHYKKKNDGPLPVKWMAPESIIDRVFSTQSDVWSFGIVLWELFSLARTPYPEMEANQGFYDKLLSGYRMSQPEYSTNAIYQIMLSCWQAMPSNRPSFNTLSDKIGTMLTKHVRQYYAELNRPYANLNDMQFKNQKDFLRMMKQPDYNNVISTSNNYLSIMDFSGYNVNVNSTDPNENKEMILYSSLDLQSNISQEDNSIMSISESDDINNFNCAGSVNEKENNQNTLEKQSSTPVLTLENPTYSSLKTIVMK